MLIFLMLISLMLIFLMLKCADLFADPDFDADDLFMMLMISVVGCYFDEQWFPIISSGCRVSAVCNGPNCKRS